MSGTGHEWFESILYYQSLRSDFNTADKNIGRKIALHVCQQEKWTELGYD